MTTSPILALESCHHHRWHFGRYSYLAAPRPNCGLLLVLQGGIRYISREAVLEVKPMELVWLPKGSRYEARFQPNTEDLLLNFRILEGPEQTVFFPALLLRNAGALAEPMARCMEAQRDGLEAMSRFYSLCRDTERLLYPKTDDERLIEEAKLRLSDQSCPSLETLSRQLSVSPSGLRQKFKAAVGISPARFRQQQRLEQAKQLLLSTDLPAATVAEACGFCDSAYFHKVFCKATGMSPTTYRDSRRQL